MTLLHLRADLMIQQGLCPSGLLNRRRRQSHRRQGAGHLPNVSA